MKATIKASGELLNVELAKEVCYIDEDGDIYYESDLDFDINIVEIEGEDYLIKDEEEKGTCRGCALTQLYSNCNRVCEKYSDDDNNGKIFKRVR